MTQCLALEDLIRKFRKDDKLSDDVKAGFDAYHFALVHKLKTANYNLNAMDDLLSNTEPAEALTETSDFIFQINMRLDAYFYACGSALDILAREILTYYGERLPTNTYFTSAQSILNRSRPTEPILGKLVDPSWRQEFSTYRNTLTHELMIAGHLNVGVSLIGDTQDKQLIIPLPDDPRIAVANRTFKTNPDALEYCKKNYKRLLTLINCVYSEVTIKAKTVGQMPI